MYKTFLRIACSRTSYSILLMKLYTGKRSESSFIARQNHSQNTFLLLWLCVFHNLVYTSQNNFCDFGTCVANSDKYQTPRILGERSLIEIVANFSSAHLFLTISKLQMTVNETCTEREIGFPDAKINCKSFAAPCSIDDIGDINAKIYGNFMSENSLVLDCIDTNLKVYVTLSRRGIKVCSDRYNFSKL